MFCNQCEQTAKGIACTTLGVCGKKGEVDYLQDLLIYALSGLSEVSLKAKEKGRKENSEVFLILEGLFATLTNVNFDGERIKDYILEVVETREKIKKDFGINDVSEISKFSPGKTMEELISQGKEVELRPDKATDEDIFSLKLTILYALKGLAAYAYHAFKLNKKNEEIYDFIQKMLVEIFQNNNQDLEKWIDYALEAGRINLKVMELLDAANTEAFGHPVPTKVPIGVKKGKAILVSGHDLKDLHELLEQTKDKGIYIYTHGEMLPAHGYPELKKYSHLFGHYGTAWHNQQKEFPNFPGPIVMTTNCLMPVKESYKDRIFTVGPVGYPGVKHISQGYSEVINFALNMEGFTEDRIEKKVFTGFARNAVLSVADKIIELVKAGKIKHFFLVGGCDGAKAIRKYYTKFVELVPEDSVVLTLGCGKFRFFDKNLGEIEGIPRLLDVGQCNDAYSAIQIALALSKAFNMEVNKLPLSLVISWYEQKAVAILLSLLYLGIKNIVLGPSLPAFLSKNVLNFIVEKYKLRLITEPEKDLEFCLNK